jgi:hypothetical protein
MQSSGVTFDLISDRQLRSTRVDEGMLLTQGNATYRVVILPLSRFIPLETFEHVLSLARNGATVISLGDWPADVSGLSNLDARRQQFRTLAGDVQFGPMTGEGIREARVGRGRILRGDHVGVLLARAGVTRERMVDLGLQFHRRVDSDGRFYFISNPGERALDGWVPLPSGDRPIVVFDPMSGRRGTAMVRDAARVEREIYLQIPAGGSLIVAESGGDARGRYDSHRAAGASLSIDGPWTVRFERGGPTRPASRAVQQLTSWTEFGGEAQAFSGTATYTTSTRRPPGNADAWQLDLGIVRESARVRLNGRDLGTLIGPPHRLVLDNAWLSDTNELEVSVTNLSANRIRDLDLRGVPWKKFYNVNFPARLPQNRGPDGLFTAAGWEPLDSGLLGPVTLTPLAVIR